MDDGRIQRYDARQLVARVGLVVFVAVALSAVVYLGWFRLYAIATIPILVGFDTPETGVGLQVTVGLPHARDTRA